MFIRSSINCADAYFPLPGVPLLPTEQSNIFYKAANIFFFLFFSFSEHPHFHPYALEPFHTSSPHPLSGNTLLSLSVHGLSLRSFYTRSLFSTLHVRSRLQNTDVYLFPDSPDSLLLPIHNLHASSVLSPRLLSVSPFIYRYNLPLYLYTFQHFRNRRNLITFLLHCLLSQAVSVFSTPCRNNVAWFYVLPLIRTHRFPIHTDYLF